MTFDLCKLKSGGNMPILFYKDNLKKIGGINDPNIRSEKENKDKFDSPKLIRSNLYENQEKRQLLIENETLKAQNTNLQISLKNQMDKLPKLVDFETNPKECVRVYEDVIKIQYETIVDLSKNRDGLLKLLIDLDQQYVQDENLLVKALEKQEELQLKVSELSELLERKEKESKKSDNNVYKILEDEVPAYIKKIKTININTNEDIINVFRLIKKHSTSLEKFNIMLSQYENCVHYINALSNRSLSSKQMAQQLQDFLEENKPNYDHVVPNIFDPTFTTSKAMMFFDMVTERELKESPLRELYALFLSSLEVTHLLFEKSQNFSSYKPLSINFNSNQHQIALAANEEKLTRLQNILDEKLKNIEDLTPKIEAILAEPSSDFFKNVSLLIKLVKKMIREREDSKIQLKMKDVTVNNLKTAFSVKEKEKYQNIIKDLNNQLKIEQEKRLDISTQSRQQLDEALAILEKYKLSPGDQILSIHDISADPRIKVLQAKIQSLETQIATQAYQNINIQPTEQQASMLYTSTITDSSEEKEALVNKITELNDESRSVKRKNLILAKKLIELKEKHKSIVDSMRSMADSAICKLKEKLEICENDLEDERRKCLESQKHNEKLVNIKNELQDEINRYKLNERSLKIKLEELEKTFEIRKQYYETQLTTQKISVTSALESTQRKHDDQHHYYRQKLLAIIENRLNEKLYDITRIDDILNKLDCILQDKTYKELLELKEVKEILECKNSIVERVKQLVISQKADRESFDKIDKENKESELEKRRLRTENIRLSANDNEASNWRKWADSLFVQLSERSIVMATSNEIRRVIEESITHGSPRTSRFLEMLRFQKIFLKSPLCCCYVPGQCLHSLRAITAVIIFTRRVQSLSGFLIVSRRY